MSTLKIADIQTYNYKGVLVERIDTIVESPCASREAIVLREWKVDGKHAFPYKYEGEVYICYRKEQDGPIIVLKEFSPNCSFCMSKEERKSYKSQINELGYDLPAFDWDMGLAALREEERF